MILTFLLTAATLVATPKPIDPLPAYFEATVDVISKNGTVLEQFIIPFSATSSSLLSVGDNFHLPSGSKVHIRQSTTALSYKTTAGQTLQTGIELHIVPGGVLQKSTDTALVRCAKGYLTWNSELVIHKSDVIVAIEKGKTAKAALPDECGFGKNRTINFSIRQIPPVIGGQKE